MARIHELVRALQPLRLGMLSAAIVLIVALGSVRRDVMTELFSSTVGKGAILVVAFTIITIPTGEWPKASFEYLTKIYYNAVVLFVVAAARFADRRATRPLITLLVADMAAAGLFSLVKAQAGRYEIGVTYDANETASLFAMTIPWGIYLLLTEKGLPRLLGLIAIPSCLLGVLQSGSRGGLIGTGALVPFLVYLSPPRKRAPFVMCVVVGAVLTVMSMGDQAVYRFRKAFDPDEYNYTTEDGRVEIWKRGLGYIKGSPLLGVGLDGFQYKELNSKTNTGSGVRQAAAHNMYIQVAAELGLIGFGGFLTMLFGAHVLCGRARRRIKQWILEGGGADAERELIRVNMAQASLYSLMCTGFFLSLGYSSMLYFGVGACLGVWLASRRLGSGPGRPVTQAPRAGVRGMRGWRSGRPVPVGAGLHGMHSPQS